MDKEKGEKRDFLPDFFRKLASFNVGLYLEKGYGQKLDIAPNDYLNANENIRFVDRNKVFKQDLVVVIRVPEFESLDLMKPGSGLLSMLHYDTRPLLLDKLKRNKINSFSLDSIVDDDNQRLMVSYEMTALGGVHIAFKEMKKKMERQMLTKGKSLKVSILGMGNLGVQAARYSFQEYNKQHFADYGIQGISVEFLDKEITSHASSVKEILKGTDVFVDATRRPDATMMIIPNEWLGELPQHAVILDLTADPYEEREEGNQVKAIEGIPHGNIDQYVFSPADEEAYAKIPSFIKTSNKRTSISCNAWPSVMAEECMEVYGEKVWPFLQTLVDKGFNIDINSEEAYERALTRSTIKYYEDQNKVPIK